MPEPDTATTPFDTRTTSSRSTHMMGRALAEAVADLRAGDGERGFGEVRNEGGLDPDTGQGIASTHWHQGAAAAHVSVDEETGRVTVEHLHGAAYAGRVVNAPGAELQNEGSMLMGLGTALFEAIEFADGQVANANLSDYNVPAPATSPRASRTRSSSATAPRCTGSARPCCRRCRPRSATRSPRSALDVRELPITPERVLAAVDAR